MDALKNLLSDGKGLVGVSLIVAATVLVALGRMTIDQWQTFATWIFSVYAGTTAIHQVALAFSKQSTPAPTPAPVATVAPTAAPK